MFRGRLERFSDSALYEIFVMLTEHVYFGADYMYRRPLGADLATLRIFIVVTKLT